MPAAVIRPLTTHDEFTRVVRLEQEIWGLADAADAVPAVLFAPTVRRGAILLGASDDRGELVGFVYSLPGLKHGRPMQWSHMMGVVPAWRGRGLGVQLKLAQRDHALAQGLTLVEWTYDPLLALNAQLNVARLGATVDEYEIDAYGDSASPLHHGAPTDRFIASWDIATEAVSARLAAPGPRLVPAGVALNRMRGDGAWSRCEVLRDAGDEPVALVAIPPAFDRMLTDAPDRALEWRLATRALFTAAFARGYQVIDFASDAIAAGGRYVLARDR